MTPWTPWRLSVAANLLLFCFLITRKVGPGGFSRAEVFLFLLSLPGTFFLYRLAARFSGPPLLRVTVSLVQAILFVLSWSLIAEFGRLPSVSFADFLWRYPQYSLTMALEALGWPEAAALLAVTAVCYASWCQVAFLRRGSPGWTPVEKAAAASWAAIFITVCMIFGRPRLMAAELHYVGLAFDLVRSLRAAPEEDRFVLNRMRLPKAKSVYARGDRPNIILFRLEEVSQDRCGLYVPATATTPFLTRFQASHRGQSFVFRDHFANSGATDVALVLMYTGLNPTRSGRDFGKFPLIWEYAKSLGYRTFLILPFRLTWGRLDERLASADGALAVDHLYDARISGLPLVSDLSILDSAVADEAIRQIGAIARSGPFFGIVSLKSPHHNGAGVETIGYRFLNCPTGPGKLPDYDCGIHESDFQISRVIKLLEERGLLDKTIFMVVSDHGADQRKRRSRLENYYQELLAIPFFLYVPSRYQAHLDAEYPDWRGNTAKPTANIDVVPTLANLLGIHHDPEIRKILAELDGKSVLQPLPEGRMFEAANTNSLRTWRPEGFALIDGGRYKYIFDAGRESLFDLKADPDELKDILPGRKAESRQSHHRFLAHVAGNRILSGIYSRGSEKDPVQP